MDDNFVLQLVSEHTRDSVPQDLLLTKREELVEDVVVRGWLGHGDGDIKVFSVCGEVRRAVSKTSTLVF